MNLLSPSIFSSAITINWLSLLAHGFFVLAGLAIYICFLWYMPYDIGRAKGNMTKKEYLKFVLFVHIIFISIISFLALSGFAIVYIQNAPPPIVFAK